MGLRDLDALLRSNEERRTEVESIARQLQEVRARACLLRCDDVMMTVFSLHAKLCVRANADGRFGCV